MCKTNNSINARKKTKDKRERGREGERGNTNNRESVQKNKERKREREPQYNPPCLSIDSYPFVDHAFISSREKREEEKEKRNATKSNF